MTNSPDPAACRHIAEAALAWYDGAARILPWRVSPAARRAGIRPDPYRVWLSEVMLQQTTVAAVGDRFRRFIRRWPDVTALARADSAEVMAEWAGLGYYARARNLIACARIVADRQQGRFPRTRDALLALPGIGPYTAAAIAAIAFDEAVTPVDGNVERVVARLFAVQTPLPRAKAELAALAATLTPPDRPGDHVQAMMDLGATICTPRAPDCAACPLGAFCAARAAGLAGTLPRRAARPARPTRRGIAYVCLREDGAALLEQRPPRGLLGGTLGWPTSEWVAGEPRPDPPVAARWQRLDGEIGHTFTHFHLTLAVEAAIVPAAARPLRGAFLPAGQFRPENLPTLMRKAHALARGLLPMPDLPASGESDRG